MIHTRFARALDAERIPGVEVEQSFPKGEDARYGELGSKRTDVIFRDDTMPGEDGRGRVVAVWDYKTGVTPDMPESRKKALTQAIHRDMNLAAATPVFVLHVPVGWASRP